MDNTLHNEIMINKIHVSIVFIYGGTLTVYSLKFYTTFFKDIDFPIYIWCI
jgi:hypothetical protein